MCWNGNDVTRVERDSHWKGPPSTSHKLGSGDGTSINVWSDAWLSVTSQLRPMGPPPISHLHATVADLLIPGTKEWDVSKIRMILPFEETRLRTINPSKSGAPDKMIWPLTHTGEYSVKTGYAAAMMQGPVSEEVRMVETITNWKKSVWKLQTTPKIKLFMWKVFHGAIPVGEQLIRRHIGVDGRCKLCGRSESINHLFFECSFAQKVWASTPPDAKLLT